jgi:ABC-type multidrug transport system permease subunit
MKERKITLAEFIYPPLIEIERDKRRYSQKRNRKDKLNISIPAAFAKIITYISYIYLIGVIAIIVAGFIYNISTSNVALRLLFFSIGFGFLLFIIYFALPIEEE